MSDTYADIGDDTDSHIDNLARTEYLRKVWPYFRDRRIDAYSELSQRAIE